MIVTGEVWVSHNCVTGLLVIGALMIVNQSHCAIQANDSQEGVLKCTAHLGIP